MSEPPLITEACPVCSSLKLEVIVEIQHAPVHCGLLWQDRQTALDAPVGEIRLTLCLACGHVFNQSFDPALMHYEQPYDNSLFFSPRFQKYARWQADRLIHTYRIFKKKIIEVGSGRGDFLEIICELGDNQGVGFDPSYTRMPGKEILSERVEFIKDYFAEHYAGLPADLIYSRHTLEHIERPVEFLSSIRKTIDAHLQTVIFLEVPNFDFTLREKRPWDILYEHCSYFSLPSLSHVCERSGFEVLQKSEAFEGQFITVDACPTPTSANPTRPAPLAPSYQMIQTVKDFAQNYQRAINDWQARLVAIRARGWKMVVWGAGAKGLSFLTTLQMRDEIGYVVDINPGKWGMFMPLTGHEIISPDFLRTYQPEVIIIMNPIYQSEIKQAVANMGLEAQFWVA